MDYVNIDNKRKTSSKNVNIVPFRQKKTLTEYKHSVSRKKENRNCWRYFYSNMALLHRFLRLNDAADTGIFTFIVTKSVTRDLHRDVTSKEFR